jgi:murein DD-endopeptidase MepM/ murein hydrolase activator NlpD
MPGGFPVRPYQIIDKVGPTCPAGYADFYRLIGMRGHNGIDCGSWHLEPVYHCGMYKGWMQTAHDQDGGLNVMVVSNDPLVPCTEGCAAGTMHYIMTIYAHGGKAIGYDKLPVVPGQNIMLADNSGDSSGDHCHWAPKWCDAAGRQIHNDNGYNGAFNPAPFFTNTFILDYLKAQQAAPTPHPVTPITLPPPAPLTTSQLFSKFIFNILLALKGQNRA